MQLPLCVKTHGQRSHRDLIQHVIIIVLRAVVQASERRQVVHARDVNIPAISIKREHRQLFLRHHLRTVRSNAGRFTTLREEVQVTAYNPHATLFALDIFFDDDALTSAWYSVALMQVVTPLRLVLFLRHCFDILHVAVTCEEAWRHCLPAREIEVALLRCAVSSC